MKKLNASLAIQLCYDWVRKNAHIVRDGEAQNANNALVVSASFADAIAECFWPGRCHTETFRNHRLFIDGAHTSDSTKICVDWFINSTKMR